MPRNELAGLPEGGPATLPEVKADLGITDDRDDARLEAIVGAVNHLVRSWPVSEGAVDGTWADDAPDAHLGARMLAGRLFRRKGSPAGVEAFGSAGAAYVMRNDPDIAMLLALGPYAPPQVG